MTDVYLDNYLDKIIRLSEKKENGCLIYHGSRTVKGYPRVLFKGRQRLIHRLNWEIARGKIPDGKFICHTCDTPECINIEHHFVGSPNDNIQDMVKKGRHYHLYKKTGVCRRGHKITKKNTYTRPDGYDSCRECLKINEKKRIRGTK